MILDNLKEHSSALVQQAVMVSEELIRVAILWHEQWHEALEEASRLVISLAIILDWNFFLIDYILVNTMYKECSKF